MPFQPGQSGNPAGKPKGSRNKTTLAMEALLDGEHEAITRKAIELAKDGDGLALRLCIERLLPPRRDRPVEFKLSKLETAADAATALSDILQAVAAGELTPNEAEALATLVAGYSRAIEIVDLEERVARLENRRAA